MHYSNSYRLLSSGDLLQEYQLLRFIDLADVHTVAAIALKKNENSFGIVTSKRQYYVRASSAKDMQDWIDALKDAQEQVKKRNTMAQDMAAIELITSSGGEGHAGQIASPRKSSASPTLVPIDRHYSAKGGVNQCVPINIVIPGKGLYTSPAQARQNSTGTSIISPLTATSDSEAGTATGAEQFGLSYASSTGQSLASSPSRGGIFHHFDHNSGGRQSPQSHSGGDDTSEAPKRSKTIKKVASGNRDASVGSSGGEGSTGLSTGWTVAGGKAPSQASQQQQAAGILSSSDEDGEGEDWDEDEIADRAMPLPGSSGVGTTHANHTTQPSSTSGAAASSTAASSITPGKARIESEIFKDLNKVIHQGYLMKQSNRRKQWRKRWFILTSAHLSYTRSHMDGKPHRQIPLTSILDAIEYTSKKSGTQPQSPSPSSPGLQSPPPFGINFQLGSNQEASSGGVGTALRDGVFSPGDSSGGAAGSYTLPPPMGPSNDHAPEKRASGANLGVTPPAQPKRKKENCFKIITPKRTYVVCAPTEEEEIKWLSAMQALLAHWRGNKEAETETSAAAPVAAVPATPTIITSSPSHHSQSSPSTALSGSMSPLHPSNRPSA
jgi:hypothetical protein